MRETDLMAIERRERIADMVDERGSVTVTELSQIFDVSETTIRRDLATLNAHNRLRRARGGAVRVSPVYTSDAPVIQRQSERQADKERIGAAAAKLIHPGETLLIAGGSTGLAVARHLHDHQNLTIVTDSLLVVETLLRNGQHRIIMVGGTVNAEERATRGALASIVLKQIEVDKVIIGTRAVSVNRGLSTESPEEAEFFRAFMRCGQNIILVTDSRKFHHSALAHIAPLSEIDCLITDKSLDEDIAEQIRDLGIYLIMV